MTLSNSMPASSSGEGGWIRQALVLGGLFLLLLLSSVARMNMGETTGGWGWPEGDLLETFWRLLRGEGVHSVFDLRLLRVVEAVIVGAALAGAGVSLQALLRNPLAEPFILGLSSGAGVGIVAQQLLTHQLGGRISPSYVGALVGGLLSMTVVYLAGRRKGMVDPVGLLLVGVVLSTVNGSLIMMLNYLSGPAGFNENLSRWMMGYLNENVPSYTIGAIGLLTAVGLVVLWRLGRAMDVATFSDAESQSLGVNLRRLRQYLFVLASLLAAGAVVLAGPIAFVGLICPHLVRLLLGPGHRAVLIGAVMAGATLIMLADFSSVGVDLLMRTGRMPIGIFTALIGGPVFVWMLRPQLGRGAE